MTVISVPQAFNEDDLYVDLRSIVDAPLYLKCEGFNFAGSIKLKAAAEMVEGAERDGVLTADSVLIESSSGNLGVALAMIAASRGYRFLCVTDPRCNLSTRRLMEALGSQVHIITEPDPVGGFLGARIDYVICDEAQFYEQVQIEQLARVVDELQIDVLAVGIMTDFQTLLFPASQRLVELCDKIELLQVRALCWCGERATHNARTVDGVMVVEGDQVVVGDTAVAGEEPTVVAYEVLCRQHHRRRLTAARARAVSLTADPLPFG